MNACSCTQIGPQLPDCGVEPWVGELSCPIAWYNVERFLMPKNEVKQAVVGDLYSLSPTWRTRCVDYIRQVISTGFAVIIPAWTLGFAQCVNVQYLPIAM